MAAVQPSGCLTAHLPDPPRGRTLILGAGKASAQMARVLEDHWDGPLSGLVVTRDGHGLPCDRIEIVEAAHPVPDDRGPAAARRMLELARRLTEDDLTLCLLSGGGSALLTLPAPGVTLAHKQAVTRALLACGAPIDQINCVRKHLSAIKGGRLAQAIHPARLLTLAISDVIGDDPAVIASGPTVVDPTTLDDARNILRHWSIDVPAAVWAHLQKPQAESPKSGFADTEYRIIARAADALAALAARAAQAGLTVQSLGDSLAGEAREMGARHGLQALRLQQQISRPTLLMSGGELTVTLAGAGQGGPNREYLLALALALDGAPGIHALAADSDGSDGIGGPAGAMIGPDILDHARALGQDPHEYLENNDSHGLFEQLGASLNSGPTGTNVNDIRLILIEPV